MSQNNIYAEVGENIRFYRKLRHMTQKELGEKLFKSMACISKYESGNQSIELHTLYKIAEILSVPVAMLLPNRALEESIVSPELIALPAFFQKFPLFLYVMNSQKREVRTWAIDVQPNLQVSLYVDAKDPTDMKSCKYIMFGTLSVCETTIQIYCTTPLLKGDFVFICIRIADLIAATPTAFVTSISPSYRFLSSKGIISTAPENDPQSLLSSLTLTKADLENIKRQQHFSI